MSNYNTQDNLTQASIPTSAQTGGFAAAGGAQPQASQSSPFAAGLQGQQPQATLGGHTLGQDPSLASGNMHPTPIAPSTYNALNAGALDASSTGSHSSSLSQQQPQAGSTISSFGNAAGNHPQHSEPNIPAAASSLAAKAPTAEEIKARGAAFVDQSAALAEQARTKAGEFVAPKEKEQLNPAEKHVDNLAGGIAGMVLTAPLAAVEKVSPVVADKLSAAASAASVQLQNAASSAGPVASSYAQSAVDAARGVLPAALGGRPAQSTGTVSSTTSTTSTTGTGPTVTERATGAASNVASSAQSTATSAAQSAQSTLASAAQTAQSYLPASIANKLPGGGVTSTQGASSGSSTSASTSTDSPYVARDEIKPTTLPADTLKDVSSSRDVDDLSSGTGSARSGFTGLAPATTSNSSTTRDASTASFSSPSHSAGPAAVGGEHAHTSSTLDSRQTQPSSIYASGEPSSLSTNQKSVYEDPSLAASSSARSQQQDELHPSSQSAPSTQYNDGEQRSATQQPGSTLGGSTAVSYEKEQAKTKEPFASSSPSTAFDSPSSSSAPPQPIASSVPTGGGSSQTLERAEGVETKHSVSSSGSGSQMKEDLPEQPRASAPTSSSAHKEEEDPQAHAHAHAHDETSVKKEGGLRSKLSKLIHKSA